LGLEARLELEVGAADAAQFGIDPDFPSPYYDGISFTSQGTPAAENAKRTRSIPLLDSIIAAG
jgi:hypothetical protein